MLVKQAALRCRILPISAAQCLSTLDRNCAASAEPWTPAPLLDPHTGAGMIRLFGYFFGIATFLGLIVAGAVGDLCRQPDQGPARLRGAGQLRAAGDDARPRRRRRADGRVRARAAPLSADPGDARPRQGGVPVGRRQEFLQAPRHRHHRPRPRAAHQLQEHGRRPAPGRRLDDHPAGRQELPADLRPDHRPQDQGR